MLTERDTIGSEITIGRKAAVAAVPGSDVVLTIVATSSALQSASWLQRFRPTRQQEGTSS